MARITVEDCLQHVDNRFELVLLATKRARQLVFGSSEPIVPWENDKATVVALREIATGGISEATINAVAMQEKAQREQQAAYGYADKIVEFSDELSAVAPFKDEQ